MNTIPHRNKISLTDQLLRIDEKSPDLKVAMLIAAKMVENEREPYCFLMSHSIRGPAFAACPLPYDWSHKDTVGITYKSKHPAERWLVSALRHGYTVEHADPKTHHAATYGHRACIASARLRAALHRQPKRLDDDDIPF